MIDRNLECIKKKIKEAAVRRGWPVEEIKLVVVTKAVGPEEIKRVVEGGVKDIGENRVQDAAAKQEALTGILAPGVRWHMLGHLQTNKVKPAVRIFDMIQSVDSLRLAREIDKRAGQIDKVMPVLMEVNISAEKSKYGFRPEELVDVLKQTAGLSQVRVRGLMTMAPFGDDAEEARPVFRILKELSLSIDEQNIDGLEMKYLSMGMSRDYEVAVEEGARMVRIGSAVFR